MTNRADVIKNIRTTLRERGMKLQQMLNGDLHSLRRDDSRSVASDDLSNAAADAAEVEISCALAEAESNELNRISEALQKIDNNTFGLCETCNGDIPLARLEALPYAVRCLQCQVEYEKESSRGEQAFRWPDSDED